MAYSRFHNQTKPSSSIFPMVKKIFFAKRGLWPDGPLNTPLIVEGRFIYESQFHLRFDQLNFQRKINQKLIKRKHFTDQQQLARDQRRQLLERAFQRRFHWRRCWRNRLHLRSSCHSASDHRAGFRARGSTTPSRHFPSALRLGRHVRLYIHAVKKNISVMTWANFTSSCWKIICDLKLNLSLFSVTEYQHLQKCGCKFRLSPEAKYIQGQIQNSNNEIFSLLLACLLSYYYQGKHQAFLSGLRPSLCCLLAVFVNFELQLINPEKARGSNKAMDLDQNIWQK